MLVMRNRWQRIASYVKYNLEGRIWNNSKTRGKQNPRRLPAEKKKIMRLREGANMLAKCLHIFTLLFLIFRWILVFVVVCRSRRCLSAQECTQRRSLCCHRGVLPACFYQMTLLFHPDPLGSRWDQLRRGSHFQSSSLGHSRRQTLQLSRVFAFPSVLNCVGRWLGSGGHFRSRALCVKSDV